MPNLLQKLKGLFFAVLLLALLQSQIVPIEAATISENKVKEIVQRADILAPEYRKQVNVSLNNDLVSISAYRYPKASQRDCKIDTILLAKEIMAAYPNDVTRIKAVYWDTFDTNMGWEIEVNSAEVKAFALGAVSKDELLKSISLTPKTNLSAKQDIINAYTNSPDLTKIQVLKGPYESDRIILITKICDLKKRAAESKVQELDMTPYLQRFALIERAVKANRPSQLIRKRIDNLVTEVSQAIVYYNKRIAIINSMPNSTNKNVRPVTALSPGEKDWQYLIKKYPSLSPNKSGQEFERRNTISKKIMQLAESGNNIDELVQQFQLIEQSSLSGNNKLLEMRISNLERHLGLLSFPAAR
jgi:hypothetical protein